MRIISGRAGSQKISVPDSVARPSTDRLREALFSILGPRVSEACVLDLFAGSGSLGLECLSRGAQRCDFVDGSRESCTTIRRNLESLKLDDGSVIQQDVFGFLKGASKRGYDLIFADPPYFKKSDDRDFIGELLRHPALPSMLADGGILILEEPPVNERESIPNWSLLDQRNYGGCGLLFYQCAV